MEMSKDEGAGHMGNRRQPLRVLCLHGFRTSGDILRRQVQLARWGTPVLDLMDLVYAKVIRWHQIFLDAPHPAQGRSNVEGKFPPPYYEWFRSNNDFTEFYGVEESVSYIADYMKLHGPFDGLLGFSQGGFFAGAFAGIEAKDNPFPKPIKFVIIIGGGIFRYKAMSAAYEAPIKCPSLHMIGEEDFNKKAGEALVKKFENPVILRHPHGHLVPRLDEVSINKFRSFLLQMLEAVDQAFSSANPSSTLQEFSIPYQQASD